MSKFSFSTKEEYADIINDGRHVCQITRAVLGRSSKGDQMITLRFKVVGPQDSAKGQSFLDWIVLKPTSWGLGKLVRICRASTPPIQGAGDSPDGIDPEDQASLWTHLIGLCIAVETELEESSYEDEYGETKQSKNARARNYLKLSGEEAEALADRYPDGRPELPKDWNTDNKGNPMEVEGYDSPASDGFADFDGDDDIPF